MQKIQYLGTSPLDVEGFPTGIERTFEGALHLKPNTVYAVSDAEFEHLRSARPELRFHVFQADRKFERPVAKVEASVNETRPAFARKPDVKDKGSKNR